MHKTKNNKKKNTKHKIQKTKDKRYESKNTKYKQLKTMLFAIKITNIESVVGNKLYWKTQHAIFWWLSKFGVPKLQKKIQKKKN